MDQRDPVFFRAAEVRIRRGYIKINSEGLSKRQVLLNLVLGYYWVVTGILLATIISFTIISFYASGIVYWRYFQHHRYSQFLTSILHFL